MKTGRIFHNRQWRDAIVEKTIITSDGGKAYNVTVLNANKDRVLNVSESDRVSASEDNPQGLYFQIDARDKQREDSAQQSKLIQEILTAHEERIKVLESDNKDLFKRLQSVESIILESLATTKTGG
jgi:hypothetical protein